MISPENHVTAGQFYIGERYHLFLRYTNKYLQGSVRQ